MQDATLSTTCQKDVLDPARSNALAVALDLPDRFPTGSALLPFFHQVYFWQAEPAAVLGRDGHPKVGGLIPDMGLPRRMWAGGRLEFKKDLQAGYEAEKQSCCEKAINKLGRSGLLGLVTLRHDYAQHGSHCVSEWQDLVYREEPTRTAARTNFEMASTDFETSLDIAFDTTMLFRYSALTFNGHRIHYDLPYAQTVEGYEGLVVHGPLLAQFLMLKATEELGPLAAFAFRATAPLFHFETATLCRKAHVLWVAGPDGRQCMTAEAKPRL